MFSSYLSSKPYSPKPMPSAPNTHSSRNPLRGAVEILPDRLYYCALKTPPSKTKLVLKNRNNERVPVQCFSVDNDLVYWNFYLDFGPLNLGQLYRFTVRLNQLLQQDSSSTILFYSSENPAKRANAIFLICAWQVLELQRTPEQAFRAFSFYSTLEREANPESSAIKASMPPPYPLTAIARATVGPLPPFHDASPCVCTFELTLMHCLQGLVKAKQFGFFDWDSFDVEKYEYYEQVENGDLNWIVEGKIMAFAGPSYKKTITPEGYCTLATSDYIPYFKERNVGLVVRLNQRNYDENDFIKVGIRHLDQCYLDGSCPPMKILQKVLSAFEEVPPEKAFAVHCKAGLGRTGTCIGAYLMKHYRMTAPEVIAWMRICRPGMVIGPQQQFLQDLQPAMWQEGEMMRINPTVGGQLLSTNVVTPDKSTASATPEDSVSGRPGQADGLLARRHHQPVPVTPDRTNRDKGRFSWLNPSS